MYEWGKVKKVPGNKILLRSILEQCGWDAPFFEYFFFNLNLNQLPAAKKRIKKRCISTNIWHFIFLQSFSISIHLPFLRVLFKNREKSTLRVQNCNFHFTEVGSATLIHFQKLFWNKVFYILKLVREFKLYIWMTISGSKSVKKSQKFLKNSHKLDLKLISPNFF